MRDLDQDLVYMQIKVNSEHRIQWPRDRGAVSPRPATAVGLQSVSSLQKACKRSQIDSRRRRVLLQQRPGQKGMGTRAGHRRRGPRWRLGRCRSGRRADRGWRRLPEPPERRHRTAPGIPRIAARTPAWWRTYLNEASARATMRVTGLSSCRSKTVTRLAYLAGRTGKG